jgi:hypothetical protein
MARQLFVYAVGRAATDCDRDELGAIDREFQAGGARLDRLVALVAGSRAFRFRRGEPGGGP